MSLKYGLLSFVIFFAVLLLAFKNYQVWTQPFELRGEQSLTKKLEVKSENRLGVSPAMGTQKDPLPPKSRISISEKNIFSPNRKDFPTVSLGKSNPVMRPQVVLYGVTITGDYQGASIVNPGRPLRKGERETLTVKLGDKIGEYQLAKILPDRITMESNGDTFEVLLYDSKNPKKRTEIRTETKVGMATTPAQAAPVPPSGEKPDQAVAASASQESVKEPGAPAQRQPMASLPFNKYTYQQILSSSPGSAAIGRGTILYSPPVQAGR